jgi:hypothetical protein
MTAYQAIPQPQNNRNQSQGDILNNFTYLINLASPPAVTGVLPVDHRITGNNSSSPSDGFHNQVSYLNRSAPSNLTNSINSQSSSAIDYTINDSNSQSQLHHYNSSNDFQITPCLPLRAAINFNGTGSVGALNAGGNSIRSSFNINAAASQKTGTGLYTIVFTNLLPSANYFPLIIGMKNTSGETMSFVQGAAAYGTSITTGQILIGFENFNGSAKDVIMGCVMIFGG